MDKIQAYAKSLNNRAEVEQSAECGCFSCEQIFAALEVAEWVNGGQTAICPVCGVDAVLPNAAVPLTQALLEDMREEYFGEGTKLEIQLTPEQAQQFGDIFRL